jgi:hypothetical protein
MQNVLVSFITKPVKLLHKTSTPESDIDMSHYKAA